MGLHGECRALVSRAILSVLLGVVTVEPALAQTRIETPDENVRRRQAEQRAATSPYWDGFILKHQGNCTAALKKLTPLAELGAGYEDAQTALGECHLQLAGLSLQGDDAPTRASLSDNTHYRSGLDWISTAANAGSFEAQAVMVSLYAAGLGPTESRVEGALWAHLYLTNPTRLNLGAPVLAAVSIDNLKNAMSTDEWLIGKQKARQWVPRYGASTNKK